MVFSERDMVESHIMEAIEDKLVVVCPSPPRDPPRLFISNHEKRAVFCSFFVVLNNNNHLNFLRYLISYSQEFQSLLGYFPTHSDTFPSIFLPFLQRN